MPIISACFTARAFHLNSMWPVDSSLSVTQSAHGFEEYLSWFTCCHFLLMELAILWPVMDWIEMLMSYLLSFMICCSRFKPRVGIKSSIVLLLIRVFQLSYQSCHMMDSIILWVSLVGRSNWVYASLLVPIVSLYMPFLFFATISVHLVSQWNSIIPSYNQILLCQWSLWSSFSGQFLSGLHHSQFLALLVCAISSSWPALHVSMSPTQESSKCSLNLVPVLILSSIWKSSMCVVCWVHQDCSCEMNVTKVF